MKTIRAATMPAFSIGLLLVAAMALTGCAGISEGVTRAVLDKGKVEDNRECHIEGPPVGGLESLLAAQERDRATAADTRVTKILMVHGIGRHIPGYSARLTEHLMRALGLNIREEDFKEIVIRNSAVSDDPLGTLRISRFMNTERTRQLLFYELTWSEIIEDEKKISSSTAPRNTRSGAPL